MGKGSSDDKDMDTVGHLSELRNRIIVTAGVFILLFFIGFMFVEDLYAFFVKDLTFKLTAISPGEILWVYFMLTGLIAVIGSIPVLSYQIWAFVKPALTPKERKVSLAYIPIVFLLFIIGLVFGYIMFTQAVLPFIISLSNDMFYIMFTVERYFRFLARATLPLAILFELPMIAMFFTSLGILTPDLMKKSRKIAYLILVIISTIITPAPDFFLPLLISLPLILIYEVSIYLSKIVYKKKEKKHREWMNQQNI